MGRRYSALRHLAWSLLLSHDPKRAAFALMVIYREYAAFFDASGKPLSGDVMFVSGFVSTEHKWLRFDESWRALMKKWGIKKPFHATHYARGQGSDYARFRNDDAERVAFESEATPIIKQNTNKPFSFGLSIDDWNEAMAHYSLPPGLDRPYSFSGLYVIQKLVKWAAARSGHGRIKILKVFFEDGDDDRGVFSDAVFRDVGQRPILQPKGDLTSFVPGDILAWRHARLLKRRSFVEAGHPCWIGLFSQLPHDSCHYLNKEETLNMAQKLGSPRCPP